MQRLSSFVALVLILAACGGTGADESNTTTTTTTTPSTTSMTASITTTTETTTTTEVLGPPAPLNGLPVEDPELLERGVLAVKVDNHPNARPQSGLQFADAVYELPVEGVTRFIALFHVNDTDYIGPIRSVRPTDPTLVNPVGAVFAISGGSGWIVRYVAGQGTQMMGEGPGMFRIGSRSAPHNLYGDTLALREAAEARGFQSEPPPDLFEWGEFVADEPAEKVRLDWGNGLIVNWEWDGTRYFRSNGPVPHNWVTADDGEDEDATGDEEEGQVAADESEGQLATDTLIVMFARRYTARPSDPSQGKSVPAMETVGSGRVLVFAGGEVAEGTWARSSPDEVIRLIASTGEPLEVPAGVPWISVFPDNRTVSW